VGVSNIGCAALLGKPAAYGSEENMGFVTPPVSTQQPTEPEACAQFEQPCRLPARYIDGAVKFGFDRSQISR
jgi:hypothetical protein